MSSDIAIIDAPAVTESEILRLHLHAKRNSLLPVSRLPLEILTTIFIYGARGYYQSHDGGRFIPRTPSWVNVSYVCSHWRNIALNCPTLWTYHFNASLRWTVELLLRSREAPLKILCFYPYDQENEIPRWASLLDEVLKHSERIQELSLDIPPWFLPVELFLCVPRIEKLVILFHSNDPDQSIAISNECMPPLHTLKLAHCPLPWHLLNLNRLEALLLVHVPFPLDMAKFLDILSSMQNLTVLELYHVLPSAHDFLSSGGPSNSSKINLPHLTSLAIAEPLSKLVPFLYCVNIPPQAALDLRLEFELGSSLDDFPPIASLLASRFSPQSSWPVFRSLLFHSDLNINLFFGLEREPPLPGQVGHNIPLKITLNVEDEDTGESVLTESDTNHVLNNIFSSLPLTTIQGLCITLLHPLSSDFWRELLGRLHGLRYMDICYGRMPDLSLLSLVTCESNEDPDGKLIPGEDLTSRHMFVPALEELDLRHITFAPDHVSWPGSMSQRALLDALSTRKQLQGRLTMIECNVIVEDE